MSKTKTFTTVVCAITLFFLFCSKNPVDQQTTENNGGQARFFLQASDNSDFGDLAHRAEAKVSAPDMDSITQELEVDSLTVSGTISDIPAGFNRKFEVTVYTDSNTVCYYGKAYMDIIAGITNNVPLTLYRYSGTGDANINGTIVDSIPSDTNIQPTVEITSPENGSQFITGDSIEITAAASDTDGEITSVSFYNGSDLLENVTETPYTYTITDAEAGSYSFVCVAYDNSGDSAVSDTVKVTVSEIVNIPPTVEITAPENGSQFITGELIEITASANDSDGTITSVSFYNGNQLLVVDSVSPYTYLITDAEAGSYSFVCVAYDNSGDSAVSDTVKVTVSDIVNVPPTVQITAPEDGSRFNTGESIEITASANDSDGTISSVKFYNGSDLLENVTETPYTYTITDAEAGSYSFVCVAYDNSGDSAVSDTVKVTVSDSVNIPPTVEITAPENGAEFNAGESIEITASANDEDGTISSVSFYNGDELLDEVTDAPYAYIITDAQTGSYSFICIAFDNSGDSAVSETVSVTVTEIENIPPTVEITAPEDGAEFNAGESIEITASANDEDGTISSVSFYNGDELLDEVTDAPYAYTITDAQTGSYSFICIAFDNSGDSAVSETVSVTVTEIENIPPTVEITAPENGAEFNAGESIEITASASDEDGTITSVSFYNGDELLDEVTEAPYTYTITDAEAGSYSLSCVAYDNSGDSAISETVNVTVKSGSDLLTKYGVPTADPFSSIVRNFTSIVTEGTDAPDMSHVEYIEIQWDLPHNGLWHFGMRTNNGNPAWYIDFTNKIEHTFGDNNPGCTISGSGFDGFDGEYYITMDGDNMVLVEKTGQHAVIFQP